MFLTNIIITESLIIDSIKELLCCCCSPSETYGRKWGDSNFQILTELPVPPQATGVVRTFNVLDIYPSEHYGLSFLDLTDAFFLQGLLFLYTFPFCKYTLHVC